MTIQPSTYNIYCGRQLKNQGGMKKHMNSCKMRPHKIIDVKVPTVALDTIALQSSVWGSHNESDFKQIINSAYEEIVHWRKNIFLLPSGASGKQFITETTRMIDLWTNKAPVFRDIAMNILMIMPSLLLQKHHTNQLQKNTAHVFCEGCSLGNRRF